MLQPTPYRLRAPAGNAPTVAPSPGAGLAKGISAAAEAASQPPLPARYPPWRVVATQTATAAVLDPRALRRQ